MLPIAALLDVGMKVLDRFVPDPAEKAKAQAELIKMQQEGRLAELNADNIENQELTKRMQADMGSDSWLSKNIRPMTLIYILTAYLALALFDAFGLDISDSFVSLLGQWGMLVMSFYFGGRTLEKVMDMKAKKDESK
jgi:Holin of 3TMs, for gene-transfer release